jgi:hypothetical protein
MLSGKAIGLGAIDISDYLAFRVARTLSKNMSWVRLFWNDGEGRAPAREILLKRQVYGHPASFVGMYLGNP